MPPAKQGFVQFIEFCLYGPARPRPPLGLDCQVFGIAEDLIKGYRHEVGPDLLQVQSGRGDKRSSVQQDVISRVPGPAVSKAQNHVSHPIRCSDPGMRTGWHRPSGPAPIAVLQQPIVILRSRTAPAHTGWCSFLVYSTHGCRSPSCGCRQENQRTAGAKGEGNSRQLPSGAPDAFWVKMPNVVFRIEKNR